jgi:hypothetical protein
MSRNFAFPFPLLKQILTYATGLSHKQVVTGEQRILDRKSLMNKVLPNWSRTFKVVWMSCIDRFSLEVESLPWIQPRRVTEA